MFVIVAELDPTVVFGPFDSRKAVEAAIISDRLLSLAADSVDLKPEEVFLRWSQAKDHWELVNQYLSGDEGELDEAVEGYLKVTEIQPFI
jgi:hypothetical protein